MLKLFNQYVVGKALSSKLSLYVDRLYGSELSAGNKDFLCTFAPLFFFFLLQRNKNIYFIIKTDIFFFFLLQRNINIYFIIKTDTG